MVKVELLLALILINMGPDYRDRTGNLFHFRIYVGILVSEHTPYLSQPSREGFEPENLSYEVTAFYHKALAGVKLFHVSELVDTVL